VIHVGHLIRILREAQGWTGKELARRAQVDKMTVVRVEKNRYKPETLKRVAKALNTTATAAAAHKSSAVNRCT